MPSFHRRSSLAVLTSLTMALPQGLVATPSPATPRVQTARSAAPAPAQPDLGWPRSYGVAGGNALLYQPQIESWRDQKHLVAWSAVSYQAAGASEPTLGTIKIEADTSVALPDRLVSFEDFKIAGFNFSKLSRDQARDLAAGLQQAIPPPDRVIALDRVLANLDKSTIRPRETSAVKADPPKIFHSTRPAILINLDGEPVWSPIQGLDLKYAVNTNWDLFQYTPSNTLYLRNGTTWLKSGTVTGPWSPAGQLPSSFSRLPADDNWKDVRASVPGHSLTASAAPTVFVSHEPAELLLIRGTPQYAPVPGTSLIWVSNTDSDLFRLGKNGEFFYLVAGRWFSAPALGGPWSFATLNLPPDFRKIPVEHPRSRVLASVPGTEQATEAVLLATVPHTARVNRREVRAPDVAYNGDPTFEPVKPTTLERAVNTDKDILKAGDLYYMCFQAVWFVSRSPNGPWEAATSIPKEIADIPASSPINHVSYVTIEADDNPNDDWTTFAYVAGYTGMMVAWGCAVWGTGWYYPPYVWYGGMYPGYYWFPRTYGFSAWYNPWTGAYGRGAAVYGPFGGAGAAAVYNPRTGTYARGAAAYGPYGSRAVGQAWNPRTGTYAQTRQGSNIYGNWGSSYVQRGDDWARTSHVTNDARGTSTRTITGDDGRAITHRGPAGGRTTLAQGAGGDIYAGHDGNVYRRQDGSWQHWSDGGWDPVERSGQHERLGEGDAGTREQQPWNQLDRDWQARSEGAQRTRDWGSYRSAPTRERAGSFRGGGFRGGRRR